MSKLEQRFLQLWECFGQPESPPATQYYAFKPRMFRFDFAWPAERVAVEVQGGTWMRGKSGHVSGKGFQSNCEKRNLSAEQGWAVFELTGRMMRGMEGAEWINRIVVLLARRRARPAGYQWL